MAVCATTAPQPAQRATMVAAFLNQLGSKQPSHVRVLALLCLGEIGQRLDLSAHSGLLEAVLAVYETNPEEFKGAASFALGNVAAGNLPHYLPQLLREMQSGKHEYLMLYALKELTLSGAGALAGFVDQVRPGLYTILPLPILNGMYCNKGWSGGNTVLRNSVGDEGGWWGAQTKGVFANSSIDSCTKASS